MYEVYADSIARAHSEAVARVIEFGEKVITENGKETLELQSPLAITVTHPNIAPFRHNEYKYSQRMLDEYVPEITTEFNKGFSYTYGERLHKYNGSLDQIAIIIDKLQRAPNSRRAIAITWTPFVDAFSDEPPCLQNVQFINRFGELNMIAMFRSNDICQAWGANAYGLMRLQEHVAELIKVKIGTLTTISNCAHVYESDLQDAKRIAYL